MAQHLQISLDPDTLAMQVAKTALRTAQGNQTRKAANVYIPSGDGTGVLIGDTADAGISRYDPATETQSPLWEGVSQEELDAKADEILAAADESTKAQIDKVNKDLQDTSDRIDSKADEILEAAKADATAKADAVDQKVQATNSKVQANADAIEAEAKKFTDYASANDTKMGEVDKDIAKTKQDLTDLSEATSKAQLDADKANRAVELARRDAQELLFNGGFEDGQDGWKTNLAGAAFTQQSSGSRSGGYRAYLNGSLGTSELVSVKPIAVTTGHRYRFDAWYKLTTALSGAGDAGGLRLQYTSDVTVTDSTVWNDFTPEADFVYTGDKWTAAQQTVLIGDGMRWIRARIAFPQPVDAYVDDASIIDYTHIWELEQAAKSAQDTADAAKDAAKDAGDAAALAKATADGKNAIYRATTDPAADVDVAAKLTAGDLWWQTSLPNLETYWTGEPNNSPSVLVDHSNEIEHMWVWNGTKWNSHTMYAEDLLVNGSIVTELLAADCVEARNIKAGAVEADAIDATALYGKTIKGGVFLTSNERLVINNEGILLKDTGGNATITMNAANGSATFRDVLIDGGSLTTPTITTGDIDASTIHGSTVTGGTVQTVNDANRGIKLTGGNLDIYREDKQRFLRANEAGVVISNGTKNVLTFAPIDGVWTLSLDGAIQSGGEISGAAITGGVIRTNTQWDSSVDAEKYRGVVITDGGMYAYKNNGKEEYSLTFDATSGEVQLDGPVLSNATLTAPVLQTNPAENRGIKIAGSRICAYGGTGDLLLDINCDVGAYGSATLTGVFKTQAGNSGLEIRSVPSDEYAAAAITMLDTDTEVWRMYGFRQEKYGRVYSLWHLSLGDADLFDASYSYSPMNGPVSELTMQADIVNINNTDGSIPGKGLYFNHRRVDWDQTWADLTLQSGASAVGSAQGGQRAGLLCFRGRVKTTGSGDNQLVDLSSCVSGFQTSSVNRTWIVGSMKSGVASTARVFIPAGSTILTVAGGPWDWVDLGSVVIAL